MTYMPFLIEANPATQITNESSKLDSLIKRAYLELEFDSFTTINESNSNLIESSSIDLLSCSFHLTSLLLDDPLSYSLIQVLAFKGQCLRWEKISFTICNWSSLVILTCSIFFYVSNFTQVFGTWTIFDHFFLVWGFKSKISYLHFFLRTTQHFFSLGQLIYVPWIFSYFLRVNLRNNCRNLPWDSNNCFEIPWDFRNYIYFPCPLKMTILALTF